MSKIVAYIDDERVTFDDEEMYQWGNLIQCDNGCEYHIFEDSEKAGQEARKYWEDLAWNDPEEFTCLVGEKTLVQWGLGQSAGPGTSQVNSLEEWLDLWIDTPEEYWASYDGQEREFRSKHPDFSDYTVAYRHN